MPPIVARLAVDGIGTEQKSHRLQVKIQLFLNHTRFDDGPPLFRVHLEDTIEVFRHVDDDGFAHRLPGQARSAAAGEDRDFEVARDFHRGENVFMSSGITTPMGSIS